MPRFFKALLFVILLAFNAVPAGAWTIDALHQLPSGQAAAWASGPTLNGTNCMDANSCALFPGSGNNFLILSPASKVQEASSGCGFIVVTYTQDNGTQNEQYFSGGDGNGTNNNRFTWFRWDGGTGGGILRALQYDSSGSVNVDLQSSAAIPLDQQALLAYSSGSGSTKLWINDSQDGSDASGAWCPYSTQTEWKVGQDTGSTMPLKGTISMLLIFDRALTQDDIDYWYNSGSFRRYRGDGSSEEADIISAWNFSEGKGSRSGDAFPKDAGTVFRNDRLCFLTTGMDSGGLDLTTATAISLIDNASNDVTGDLRVYQPGDYGVPAGEFCIDPPSGGWPESDNPLHFSITSSLTDFGSTGVSTGGGCGSFPCSLGSFNVSDTIQDAAIPLTTSANGSAVNGGQHHPIYSNGKGVYAFYNDSGKTNYIAYCGSVLWTEFWCDTDLTFPQTVTPNSYNSDIFHASSFYWDMFYVTAGNFTQIAYPAEDGTLAFLDGGSRQTSTAGAACDNTVYSNGASGTSVSTSMVNHIDSTNNRRWRPMTAIAVGADSEYTINFCISAEDENDGYVGFDDDSATQWSFTVSSTRPRVQLFSEGFSYASAWLLYNNGSALKARRWTDAGMGSEESVLSNLGSKDQFCGVKTATKIWAFERSSSDGLIHYASHPLGASGSWTDHGALGSETVDDAANMFTCMATGEEASGLDPDGWRLFMFKVDDGDSIRNDLFTIHYDGNSADSDWAEVLADVVPQSVDSFAVPYAEKDRVPIEFGITDPLGYHEIWLVYISQDAYTTSVGDGTFLAYADTSIANVNRYPGEWNATSGGLVTIPFNDRAKHSSVSWLEPDGSITAPVDIGWKNSWFDVHGAPTGFLDLDGYLHVFSGGRLPFSGYTGDTSTYVRTSLCAVTSASCKPYMMGPEVDTGAPGARGYRSPATDSDGTTHLLFIGGSGGEYLYIANDQDGEDTYDDTTTLVDWSCITSGWDHTYFGGLHIDADDNMHIYWYQTKSSGESPGHEIYYAKLTYDSGTQTYSAEKADGTSMTLPMKPDETGCTVNADTAYAGYADGAAFTGGILSDANDDPLLLLNKGVDADTPGNDLIFVKYVSGTGWSTYQDTGLDSDLYSNMAHHTSGENVYVVTSRNGDISYSLSPDLGDNWGAGVTMVSGTTNRGFWLRALMSGEPESRFVVVYQVASGDTSGGGYYDLPWGLLGVDKALSCAIEPALCGSANPFNPFDIMLNAPANEPYFIRRKAA